MEREVIVRVDSKENYVCRFPSVYLKDKEKAQWYMEKIKSPSAEIYKAKWTANGLIYTHKMNEKGEFEEIIKSQEQIKAEAFDLLKACVGNVYCMQLVKVEEKPHKNDVGYIAYALKLGGMIVMLSKEQYEILQKAGLE